MADSNSRNKIIHEVRTEQKLIAFTFDDGPNPDYTPQFMEIFQAYGGHATFYVIGERVDQHPELAHSIHEGGHELGNHTWTHPHMTELSVEERGIELERTAERIVQITGARPTTFRPPYLDVDEALLELTASSNCYTIGAMNLSANDWEQPGVDWILDHTRNCIYGGSILLFHDGFGDRSQSLEAVRILVPEVVAQGYRLVTVRELLQNA